MVREIAVETVTKIVCDMCIQANHFLSPDMEKALKEAGEREERDMEILESFRCG